MPEGQAAFGDTAAEFDILEIMQLILTPELLIEAYKQGLFPMAYSGDSQYVHWVCPEERGQLPILDLHIPQSLKKLVLSNAERNVSYNIKINSDFRGVMKECALQKEDRPETWINEQIIDAYCDLHKKGFAHSVECWSGDTMVGGLYGVAIGGAFFGESMFSRESNTSKLALVHLCARLWRGGYQILDTQFVNDHLKQFGVYEISHGDYMAQLRGVLKLEADFLLEGLEETELIKAYFTARESQ